MTATYFGLICPRCNAGYPLGNENKRDWRYGVGDLRHVLDGQWELTCIRCGARSYFEDFVSWDHPNGYSAGQMAAAGLHVRRVPSQRGGNEQSPES